MSVVVRSIVAALFVVVMLSAAAARAGEVGTLVCHSPQAQGYIVASAKTYSCTFSPTEGGVQHYQATISLNGRMQKTDPRAFVRRAGDDGIKLLADP